MPTATLEKTQKSRASRWWIAAGTVVAVLIIAAAIAASYAKPWARQKVLTALKENYSSGLDVKDLDISLFPSASITGHGFVLQQKDQQGGPPLVAIQTFTASTGFWDLLEKPIRIRHVRLEGLEIHVRTGDHENASDEKQHQDQKHPHLVIDEVIADGTRLETIPDQPNKIPLVWEIKKLTLHDTGVDQPMSFVATLTNAKPPGDIHTEGSFGPWHSGSPSLTPVSGSYTFRDADLSVFPGLAGILSSDGKYKGVLARIEVEGTTDTPKFELLVSKNPVHLTTKFQAVVNGTDGTTQLVPVEAHFGRSAAIAKGIVDTTPNVPGKVISLDVTVPRSRLEDLLRLGAKGKAALTGGVGFHTKLVIPPGNQDISQRLRLDGSFDVAEAHFTSPDAQNKIDSLSQRGRGKMKEGSEGDDAVASDFKGHFQLRDGRTYFSSLSFSIPGIDINLTGTYGLTDEQLDFHGTARTQARLSQMTTGIKSFLLKAVDPFFAKKGAGAVLPLKITGTRDNPQFGLDVHRK